MNTSKPPHTTRRHFLGQSILLLTLGTTSLQALPKLSSLLKKTPTPAPTVPFQTCRIRGFRYYQPIESLDKFCLGDQLTLAAAPDNPHDPRAVKVFHKKNHIGYLPRESNDKAFAHLTLGNPIYAKIEKITPESYSCPPLKLSLWIK
ncbi:MAG: HIRAN domain-containing protein [Chthoniobacterales bacterium]